MCATVSWAPRAGVPASRAVSLMVCCACVSPWPSSTPSSATSTATSSGCWPAYERAEAAGCDLVVFPELAVTGYPPEDLVLKPGFVADNEPALAQGRRPHRPVRGRGRLRRRRPRPVQRRGGVRRRRGRSASTASGSCPTTPCSTRPATSAPATDGPLELYVIGGVRVGVSICEDAWSPDGPIAATGRRRRRADGEHQRLAVLAGQGPTCARRCSPPAPPTPPARSST